MKTDQHCFDSTMQQWFHSFFLLQDEGYDMKQADYIAYEEAKTTYEVCTESTGRMGSRNPQKRARSRQ